MSDKNHIQRIRGGCHLWLSSQCVGGRECTCLPPDKLAAEQRRIREEAHERPGRTIWRKGHDPSPGDEPSSTT